MSRKKDVLGGKSQEAFARYAYNGTVRRVDAINVELHTAMRELDGLVFDTLSFQKLFHVIKLALRRLDCFLQL